jgi:hypothetical protein
MPAILGLVLLLLFAPLAHAQGHVDYAQTTAIDPVRPTLALSAGSSGSVSANVSATITLRHLSSTAEGSSVHALSFAPTLGMTYGGNALFTIGSAQATAPGFGGTGVTGGLLLAYTLERMLARTETVEWRSSQAAKQTALDACKQLCGGAVAAENRPFCDLYNGKTKAGLAVSDNPLNYDISDFCPVGVAPIRRQVAQAQLARYRYPVLDLSVWGGGGASQFSYYSQDAPMTSTTPAMYSAANKWRGNGAGALQLTSVQQLSDAAPVAATVEVPFFVKSAYQQNPAGTACKAIGVVSSDGSTLSSCAAAQPVGAPQLNTSISIEAYLGLVDYRKSYWRVALGAGYSHDWLSAADTWSLKVPFYLNASALAGATPDDTPERNRPVKLDYSGVIRIVPIFTSISAPNRPAGWTLTMNLDLLGQRNLFQRADALLK